MKQGYFINCMSYKNKSELTACGVYRKVEAQIRILAKYTNITHELHNMYGKYTSSFDKLIRRLPFTGISERWKYDSKYSKADFIYFRKDVIDLSVYSFLSNIKKRNPKVKIILEIPTYPYDAEIKRGLKTLPFYLKDMINRRKLHRCVDRIVTFSQHNEIFKIKTIKTINGFDFTSSKIANFILSESKINVIAVSALDFWHGYDRLLSGLVNYYNSGGKRNIIFHIVGEGLELEHYKQLTTEYEIEEHVIFHGLKYGADLDLIYDQCSLAVECLGLHRKGLHLSSSLKSREYAAKGLPIISSAVIDYLPKDYKYLLKVPSDESPIDVTGMINFYDSIYENTDPRMVASFIHMFGKERCDMEKTMQPVIDYLLENKLSNKIK